ncbi:MAG: transposase [Opitutales bacterium]|nr:transposase [Opitutales bacterium]
MNKERLLGDEEAKDRFVAELRRVADFCGVQVLTFCVMSNHYHILVRVDPRAKEADDKELVRRFRALYGEEKCPYINMDARRVAWVLDSKLDDAKELRAHLRGRMGDLAGFMKTLKQRYSVWYNGERGRVGTLWAERYKSCVVQDSAAVLRVVGAYIELNPVRAGLAERAEAYRWSGWGAATGGEVPQSLRAWARAGIAGMLGTQRLEVDDSESRAAGHHCDRKQGEEAKRYFESYRLLLRVKDDTGRLDGKNIREEAALGLDLMERIPGMLRGAVVGTRRFVAGWCARTDIPRRPEPAASVDGAEEAPALCNARRPRTGKAG